ncbi:MAG: hypothetical protein A2015_07590 [Spirochaetes bacterium GWF1_31_7]|nr:MAG: hypothetical protein A2Y30_01685 [Spirochaetes bacterium GWE1_32_154]OHD46906.1 MAG: hypothetical protein A2015_07590 [Spirochaetes bacterium GWF1_31_7]OHD48684.1 MAG: hypothetical protein A2Y29_13815 [Spirochaetes bacterium GWE2_31_10]HBD94910.1 hypothetical protein [Spirochaetia bacterium]HBI36899.1 hypothetical protein [Spirochaetia bacterium]
MSGLVKVNLLTIAYRNLSRHMTKTIITSLAVCIGISLYIFMDAMLLGADIDTQRNIVNYETGSAKIYSKAYYEKKDEMPVYELFYNYNSIIETMNKNGWNAAPRVIFAGSLISPSQEMGFVFHGIDIEREKTVLQYDRYLTDGVMPEKGTFQIALGSKGARNLGVKPGDLVRLNTVIDKKDENGVVRHINQLLDFTVSGIIHSPNPRTNGAVAYLPLDILQDDMGLLLEGGVTEIIMRKKGVQDAMLPNASENIVNVQTMLKDILPNDFVLISWFDDAKDFITLSRSKSAGSKTMIFFLFLLAFMGISNTMLMAVLERGKEIGMMRALGMTNSMITKIFFYEAGLIGFIGGFFGVILGVALNVYMVNVGIDFGSMMDQMGMDNIGYRISGTFKSTWNYSVIAGSWIIGTIIAAFTAIPPVKRILKMPIAEALRFE